MRHNWDTPRISKNTSRRLLLMWLARWAWKEVGVGVCSSTSCRNYEPGGQDRAPWNLFFWENKKDPIWTVFGWLLSSGGSFSVRHWWNGGHYVCRGCLLFVYEVLEINPRVLHMLGKHSYHGGAAYSWEDRGSGQSLEDRSRAVCVCVYTLSETGAFGS